MRTQAKDSQARRSPREPMLSIMTSPVMCEAEDTPALLGGLIMSGGKGLRGGRAGIMMPVLHSLHACGARKPLRGRQFVRFEQRRVELGDLVATPVEPVRRFVLAAVVDRRGEGGIGWSRCVPTGGAA